MSDKIKKCSSCGKDYDFEFHGKCPGCGSDEITTSSKKITTSSKKITLLSEKYFILKVFKGLAYLIMIVITGSTIYSLAQISKYGGGISMDGAMLTLIINYVVSIFSLFCITKIIDFLFDLDKKS